MPEPVGILWSMPETKKKAPIIKVSCGIGDTDGFPAFDVESDAYDSKDDTKWGFLITGGAEFHMPLTVFQVSPNGIADKSGVRLGDIILEINEEDATQLTLSQAHERINAYPKKVQFLMRNMEDDDPTGMFEAGEEKSIVMRVPKPLPPPKGRVVPTSIELRLLEMQRKLSAIAEIPKILSSTLATVSQSFGAISAEAAYKRKCSYDEDVLDYELMDSECETDQEQPQPDAVDEDDDGDEDDYDDDGVDDEAEEDLVQVPDDDVDEVQEFKSKLPKDATPESDYASEANYATDKDEVDDRQELKAELLAAADDDDNTVYFIKLPAAADMAADATSATDASNINSAYATSDDDDADDVDDENGDELSNDGSDFLSTTYTWNLRNVPRLSINDADGVCNLTLNPQPEEESKSQRESGTKTETSQIANDTSKVRAATPTPTPTPSPNSTPSRITTRTPVELPMDSANTSMPLAESTEPAQKLLFKMDNLERTWPWADREKIIYKQSTCHLVSRKPLGLVGQRVQLLAKQEFLRKDKAQ